MKKSQTMILSCHCHWGENSIEISGVPQPFYGKYERRLLGTFPYLSQVVFLLSAFLNLATMLEAAGMVSRKDQFVTPVMHEGSRQNQSETLF